LRTKLGIVAKKNTPFGDLRRGGAEDRSKGPLWGWGERGSKASGRDPWSRSSVGERKRQEYSAWGWSEKSKEGRGGHVGDWPAKQA